MRIAYFDCFSGISGDMILGALTNAGLALPRLKKELAKLPFKNYQLKAQKVIKSGFAATQIKVILKNDNSLSLNQMHTIIKRSKLSNPLKEKSINILKRLAEAETKAHTGKPARKAFTKIHLHELGSPDTLIDIVGTVIGLALLGINKVYISPLPLNYGLTRSAHGSIPLPAPATMELLKGFQLYPSPHKKELVTPTGAVLISVLGEPTETMPVMKTTAIGYGAGSQELTNQPNLLRVIIGESANHSETKTETVWCIESNIDDTSPEIMAYLIERLQSEGALDAIIIPVQMKKSRPGFLLQVITQLKDLMKLETLIFNETTTIGIRHYPISRTVLDRKTSLVKTRYGKVKVKIARQGKEIKNIAPEYESCRKLAQSKKIPLKLIYQEVYRHLKTSYAT